MRFASRRRMDARGCGGRARRPRACVCARARPEGRGPRAGHGRPAAVVVALVALALGARRVARRAVGSRRSGYANAIACDPGAARRRTCACCRCSCAARLSSSSPRSCSRSSSRRSTSRRGSASTGFTACSARFTGTRCRCSAALALVAAALIEAVRHAIACAADASSRLLRLRRRVRRRPGRAAVPRGDRRAAGLGSPRPAGLAAARSRTAEPVRRWRRDSRNEGVPPDVESHATASRRRDPGCHGRRSSRRPRPRSRTPSCARRSRRRRSCSSSRCPCRPRRRARRRRRSCSRFRAASRSTRTRPRPAGSARSQATGRGESAVVKKITWSGGQVRRPRRTRSSASTPARRRPRRYTFNVRQTYSDGSVVDWTGPGELGHAGAPIVARCRRSAAAGRAR